MSEGPQNERGPARPAVHAYRLGRPRCPFKYLRRHEQATSPILTRVPGDAHLIEEGFKDWVGLLMLDTGDFGTLAHDRTTFVLRS